MDIVCKSGSWDVILEKDNTDDIVGFLVYFTVKRYGKPVIIMPPLVPFLHMVASRQQRSKLSLKTNFAALKLEAAIPKDLAFYTQSYLQFSNWLPFYWKGYSQTILIFIPNRRSFKMESDKCSNKRS
ncbi:MAG: hypothetical protein U0T36_08555 [Saprospiraceae bacterium]